MLMYLYKWIKLELPLGTTLNWVDLHFILFFMLYVLLFLYMAIKVMNNMILSLICHASFVLLLYYYNTKCEELF